LESQRFIFKEMDQQFFLVPVAVAVAAAAEMVPQPEQAAELEEVAGDSQ
jgi:hypothetical protein